MNEYLSKRLSQVREALSHTSVSVAELSPSLLNTSKDLCEFFDLPFGSLIRMARTIQLVDREESLTIDHLREAAQHLLIGDDATS